MKGDGRIFVYTEAAPANENVVARGLHRAASPILKSIGDHIEGIAIYPVGRRFQSRELDPELAPLCTTVSPLGTIVCKAIRRFLPKHSGFSDLLPALIFARRLRRSPAKILFSFVGADAGVLKRVQKLAALADKEYILYVVDDFLTALRVSEATEGEVRRVDENAGVVFRGARHIFSITDGLSATLGQRYGASVTTLGLAFEPGPKPQANSKLQIIYVGSINFLYALGLQDLIHAVERVRRTSGVDLLLRLTLPHGMAEKELGPLPPFVISAPAETSIGLAQEIASSLFAFLPYSFEQRERAMVETSFPSKSMEYLAYARSIVVYGPEYGVATKLFRENGLPSVVSSPKELESTVQSHLAIRPDHSSLYREYLLAAHSKSTVRKILCTELDK